MQSGEKEGNSAHACAAFMRENLEGSPYSSINVSFFKSSYLFGQFLFSQMEEFLFSSQGEGGGRSEFLDFSGSYVMVSGC